MFKKNYWQLLVNAYDRDQVAALLVALLIPALALSVPRLREGSVGMVPGAHRGLPLHRFLCALGAEAVALRSRAPIPTFRSKR